MAVSDWSTTAADNTTIDGTNIAENCSPGGINNAIRSIMAAVRAMYDALPVAADLMPKAGGKFTGDIVRDGQGAYSHNADSALTDGKVYFLAEGSTLPAAAPGRVVWFYQ
ncbi:MAG: hypothetical protein ACTHKQ_25845 [Mesorhizobium sp.]